MMNIKDVITKDWQISATGFGEIAQGANDVNQCINIILATQKGSDPLRQDFGVDLLSWIDSPVNVMGPGLSKEIIEQIADYEPRINLKTVNYSVVNEQVVFALTWTYRDGILPQGFSMPGNSGSNTVYFVLTDENGFILLTDFDTSLILS